MPNHQTGRAKMRAWEDQKPKNFFLENTTLQAMLTYYLGKAYAHYETDFVQLGAQAATIIDQNAKVEDLIGNHPRLERYSHIGERQESILFHPHHDDNGRIVWESGMMALQARVGQTVAQMGLYYLLCHNGEMGHLCSLACTSGLVRALQQAADAPIRDKFLPPLLERDYDRMQHGAQFLTEVQGGSDVGANSILATPAPDGTWRITGEKWFCSNVNAQQFLMTARATDSNGTKGLGLFLVPRTLDDGTTNAFFIRRLKDKLGTRTLASAELDFEAAVAYPVGAIDTGFKTVVEQVLNTSRLMNAVACAGIMQRAYYEARHYALTREAFGQAIAHYPLVQESIADLYAEAAAATASSFYLAHLLDKIETKTASKDEQAMYRLFVNVNKYLTSIRGTEMVHRAIEVLGGNGAIESFSILPRLYRDMVVLESWEGTHNVLAVQVVRDIGRFGLHEAFFTLMNQHLAEIQNSQLAPHKQAIEAALMRLVQWLARLMQGDASYQQAHARRLIDQIGVVAQGVLLLHEAHISGANGQVGATKEAVLAHFVARHLLPSYDAMADEGYLARVARVMFAHSDEAILPHDDMVEVSL